MNFLLSILLDISASADDSPYLTLARKPLEALIADWMRQGEEIHRLRRLGTEQTRCHQWSRSAPSDLIR